MGRRKADPFLHVSAFDPYEHQKEWESDRVDWDDGEDEDLKSPSGDLPTFLAKAGIQVDLEERELVKKKITLMLKATFLECQSLCDQFGLGFDVGSNAAYSRVLIDYRDGESCFELQGGWESSNCW